VVEVLNGYILNNEIVKCWYAVVEEGPAAGWTLDAIDANNHQSCGTDNGPDEDLDLQMGLVSPQDYDDCDVDFDNSLDHIPLTVTKTFVGRDYYTTVDRADFHLNTPGLCGNFPFDPFGGLLGSVGVFRTINAAQDPQLVIWLPHVPAAFWTLDHIFIDDDDDKTAGACTYRIQENNAPEGCVAVSPDGSTADGPYWEQTWAPGTTEFLFNIVNDCSPPEPDPTPEVAPTTAPKGHEAGAKKPSSGGTAAPKFTG